MPQSVELAASVSTRLAALADVRGGCIKGQKRKLLKVSFAIPSSKFGLSYYRVCYSTCLSISESRRNGARYRTKVVATARDADRRRRHDIHQIRV